jgi:hypothetical protein
LSINQNYCNDGRKFMANASLDEESLKAAIALPSYPCFSELMGVGEDVARFVTAFPDRKGGQQ